MPSWRVSEKETLPKDMVKQPAKGFCQQKKITAQKPEAYIVSDNFDRQPEKSDANSLMKAGPAREKI